MSIRDSELAAIRSDLNNLMDQSAVIYRETETNVGGFVETSEAIAGTASCLLAKANRQMMPENLDMGWTNRITGAGREAEMNFYILTVPYDTDLRPDDKVSIGGDSYAVRAMWDDHSLRASRRALVAKVD